MARTDQMKRQADALKAAREERNRARIEAEDALTVAEDREARRAARNGRSTAGVSR